MPTPPLKMVIEYMQREEPDKPESPKKAVPTRDEPDANGDALEISLDLPGQKPINLESIILNSPEQQKTSSSEEEWLDVDTGEPSSASKVRICITLSCGHVGSASLVHPYSKER